MNNPNNFIYGAKSAAEARLAELIIHLILGWDKRSVNIKKAQELAKHCPCMSWIIGFPSSSAEFAYYLSGLKGNVYAYGLSIAIFNKVPTYIKKLAEDGCPVSQMRIYETTNGGDYYLELAMSQNYSKAFYHFGMKKQNADMIRKSTELGCLLGMDYMIRYTWHGPEHSYWLCQAFICGDYAVKDKLKLLPQDKDGNTDVEAAVQIGHMTDTFPLSRKMYLSRCESYREAIYAWSIVARRAGICKDIRLLIGRIVWSQRVYRIIDKADFLIRTSPVTRDEAQQEMSRLRLSEEEAADIHRARYN